jgi:Lon-like protease
MNDSNPVEAESPPPVPTRRRGRRVFRRTLSALGVLVVLAFVAGFLIHLPYVIISPGEAKPLDHHVVMIDGAQTYPHHGNVLFLTVRVSNHDPNVWRVVASWLNSDRDVVDRETVVGCLSDTENETINARLMKQSQDDAKKVALTRLGYTVEAEPPEVTVTEVCQGAPAYHKLTAGDRVLAVDDQPVHQLADVAPLVQKHKPGDTVTVSYTRGGTTETTSIVAGKISGGGRKCVTTRGTTTGTACLGVSMEPFVKYRFPINVTINTQQVGGPSAGLAFTLAIIDDLTPGDLTGGHRVAVTGTIAGDGTVGPVGGVEQKAITARHNGVSLMIVPRQELKDARAGAGKVRVVGVDTVDDALAALQKAGNGSVPQGSSTAARS